MFKRKDMGKSRQNRRNGTLPTRGEDITGEIYENTRPTETWGEIEYGYDKPIFNAITGVLNDNMGGMTSEEISKHFDDGYDIVDIGEDASVNYSWRDEGYINETDWKDSKPYLSEYLDDMTKDGVVYLGNNGRYFLNREISGVPSSAQIKRDMMEYYNEYE